MQKIDMDLITGVWNEASTDLSQLEITCVSNIKIKGDLITILCEKDHSLNFLKVNSQSLERLDKVIFFADNEEL